MNVFKKIFLVILSIAIFFSTFNIEKVYAMEKSASNSYYIVINCKTNKMGYYKNGKLVKTFSVATGKSSTPTPKGKFTIVNKIKNRPYYSGGIPGGDPRNPLGDRWLGLHVGATYGTTYGIHGNNNSSSIGTNVSGGCIRMHNSDIRWLFEQVPNKTQVIIYSSNESFVQAAKKYGINLTDQQGLSNKQKEVQSKFKDFKIYGPIDNKTIDLSDKNSIIENSNQADNILRTYANNKPTDRQLFLNAWNSLSNEEKNNVEMQKIWKEYESIIAIVEAAQASNKFFENIKLNAGTLINDVNKANNLNSLSNMELGARGKAKKEYDEATKYGEQSNNSNRMKNLNEKYLDASYFLEIPRNLNERNVDKANENLSKIKDSTLKNIAQNRINNYSDINGHWAEKNIKLAMNNGWVTTSNIFRPNNSITRAEFITIVNNAFGFNKIANISFKDVKFTDWYYEGICIAVEAGYISGYSDNTFKPNSPITREEVASIITTIKNNKDSNLNKLSMYLDAHKVSSWAKSSVEGAIESGYMGAGSKYFNPKSNITRAETIVTIERVNK